MSAYYVRLKWFLIIYHNCEQSLRRLLLDTMAECHGKIGWHRCVRLGENPNQLVTESAYTNNRPIVRKMQQELQGVEWMHRKGMPILLEKRDIRIKSFA